VKRWREKIIKHKIVEIKGSKNNPEIAQKLKNKLEKPRD
jgi:hypothetical protein